MGGKRVREKINRLYEKSIDKLREKQALFLEIERNPEKIFTDLYESSGEFGISVFGHSRKITGEVLSRHEVQAYVAELIEQYISTIDCTIVTSLIDKKFFPGEIGLFYKKYAIARFSIYDKKFINVWENLCNPYEKQIEQTNEWLEKLKQEKEEYREYIKNPKSILKKFADAHIIQKAHNRFYLMRNTQKIIDHYKEKKISVSYQIKRYEEQINRDSEKSADFDAVAEELAKKYEFWKDKFLNEFGYTFEDRGFGAMSYTTSLLKKLNKCI